MPDINQKRLDQMIENAMSYEQSIPPEGFNPWAKKFKYCGQIPWWVTKLLRGN